MPKRSSAAVALLFAFCLCSFLLRGPYRYLQGEPGDHATNYSAGRCWAKGENPYDHPALDREFHNAGGPAFIVVNQHERASIYLVSAMPFFAAVSWLPWKMACVLWLLLSLAAIAAGAGCVLRKLPVGPAAKWITASAMLVFCTPALFGLLAGNPSIPVVGLTILSVYLARGQRLVLSGIMLGIAFSVKPQVGIGAVAALTLWRYWRPVWISLGALLASTFLGYLRAGSVQNALLWTDSMRRNISLGNAPGGVTDFSTVSGVSWQMVNAQAVTSNFFHDHAAANLSAWTLCGLLLLAYALFRFQTQGRSFWRDLGVLVCLSMLPVYHRVHDANILLLLIPLAIELWKEGRVALATFLAISLGILFAPTEKLLLHLMQTSYSGTSIVNGLLIHSSAVLMLLISVLATWSIRGARKFEMADPLSVRSGASVG